MKCLATFSENSLYKIKLAKTRKNVIGLGTRLTN